MRALLSILSILLIATGCSHATDRKSMIQSTRTSYIPLHAFYQRWNATNLEMSQLFPLHDTDATFLSFLHLNLQLDINQHVQSIHISATPTTQEQRFLMISFWAQTIATVLQSTEGNTVSEVFRLMGIGANADLSQLRESDVVVNPFTFKCTSKDGTYAFTVQQEAMR